MNMAQPESIIQRRIYELDGMRGWASLSVMFSHLLFGVFVKAQPPAISLSFRPFFEPLLGGTLDVAIFFVLSGEALSASYWSRASIRAVARSASKRYFRLSIPILASCAIVFMLARLNLLFHREAASLLHVEDWLGTFLQKQYSVGDLFDYAAAGVYCCHKQQTSLDPFLGTMRDELVGSFLVFLCLALCSRTRAKFAILLVALAGCLFVGSFLACFPFGMLCGYYRSCLVFKRLQQSRFSQTTSMVIFCLALILGTYCNRIWPGWLLPSITASCILVFAVQVSVTLKGFFSLPLSRWLGRVSFPLYLVHFPIIVSFTSGAVVSAHAYGVLDSGVIWLIVICSAALSLFLATLFMPVEIMTESVCNIIGRMVVRDLV